MYKLIFADDEALVRNNISKLVQWEKCGFELIGCCSNGHELLEIVEKDPPDLVITDIDMPFISGIDVARQLRRDYPTVKIIFLTGYDDFNYAQQAIDLNVEKYILKPVTARDLIDCLNEMKKILDNERLQRWNMALLKNFYHQNIAMLQNSFINSLLTSEVSDTEAAKKVEMLGLEHLAARQFQVAVLMGDSSQSREWEGESNSLMNFAVWNITKEIIEDRRMGTAIISGEKVVALLANANKVDKEKWRDDVLTVLEEIRATIEKYLKFTVTIGVGNIYKSYGNIHKSYNEAVSSLGYCYVIGTNRIIFVNDIEPHRHNALIFDKEKELRLLSCIKSNDRDGIIRMVASLMKDASRRASIVQLKNYVISIIICIIREAESIGLNTSELQQLGDIRNILDLNTVKQMQDVVLKLCFSLMENISQNRLNNCSVAIEKAKCFIHENYSDSNISVGVVSQYLNLSPSYFRAIFKKETGTTFINYLTELRMKKARDLIACTNMKNYEIAEAVGYSDPYYFSYCFKKHFNMSPSEFRESLELRCRQI